MSTLALSWFPHRRTQGLCEGLTLELVVLTTTRRGALRYLELTFRTIALLLRRRPRVVLVQNPSLILAVLCVTLKRVLRFKVVADAHNEAVEPYINRQRLIRWLTNRVLRKADLTIVTNEQLAKIVEAIGGRPFVLADKVPEAQVPVPGATNQPRKLVLIATFAPDEPLKEVLEAVRDLPLRLFVTGNVKRLPPELRALAPANITFTGFLPEDEYWKLLGSADAVVDLTTMDNCLVCGAYESLALARPMLLSRSDASVALFGDCALFTDNSVPDIRAQVMKLETEGPRLAQAAERAKTRLEREWNLATADLRARLRALA